MEYIVKIEIPTIIKVNAKTKDEAIKMVYDSLIADKTIKPADQYKIEIIDEVK